MAAHPNCHVVTEPVDALGDHPQNFHRRLRRSQGSTTMSVLDSPIIEERMTELVACLSDTSPRRARTAVAEAFGHHDGDDNLRGLAQALVLLRTAA